ncbi:MAG TPA: glycosyltransferase [Thiolapillus brandeum]|uniref:Glycosyltransferase n=1 Tax=Thiolapillus brandeum TaxID=1076588 RepID=A0A831WB43_9GAMM|nr:glycosyltransferase [Thiolapillus brandeum]
MSASNGPRASEDVQAAEPTLSVVVPIYNEKPVLPQLYDRLREVLQPLAITYEIVLVDDGSKDGSGEYMVELARESDVVKAVRLSRNFGKEAALTAGLSQASGAAVIVLDADLQDPPELIPKMLDAWKEGVDVVTMKRRSREGETHSKRFSAYLFYRLLNRLSDFTIPEDTGDFRLMSRRALDALLRLPERNRYMKGLFAWVGFPTIILEYDRAPRAAGETKWNYFSLLGLAFEGITSFSIGPLRWMIGLGAFTALLGLLFGCWIILKTLFLGEVVRGYPSLIAVVTFLGGVQLLSIGILGEYVGKTYVESKQRPLYLIHDITGPRGDSGDTDQ